MGAFPFPFSFPDPERSGQPRIVVTVAGRITEIPERQDDRGARHQIFLIKVAEVLDNKNHADIAAGEIITIAIRYGDDESLPEEVPGLQVGEPIALRGVYIPKQNAADTDGDGVRTAVIHFAHRPVGWVLYHGERYE